MKSCTGGAENFTYFSISFHEKNTIQFWGLKPWNHSRPVAADQAVTVESPKPVESQPEVEITGSTGSCLKDGLDSNLKTQYGGGSKPITINSSGMNIYLQAILRFTRGTSFWPIAILGLSIPEKYGFQITFFFEQEK